MKHGAMTIFDLRACNSAASDRLTRQTSAAFCLWATACYALPDPAYPSGKAPWTLSTKLVSHRATQSATLLRRALRTPENVDHGGYRHAQMIPHSGWPSDGRPLRLMDHLLVALRHCGGGRTPDAQGKVWPVCPDADAGADDDGRDVKPEPRRDAAVVRPGRRGAGGALRLERIAPDRIRDSQGFLSVIPCQ